MKIEMNGGPKAGFTLIEAITASGEKLSFLIPKRSTQKIISNLADAFPEQLITRRVDGRIRTFP
jgi:hypothetical protein